MEQLQNRNGARPVYCGQQNMNANNRLCDVNNSNNNPLNEPEAVINFEENSTFRPLQLVEELEEDIFSDFEADSSTQEGYSESDEQVVPSSQLSNSHKYPDEDLSISDNEEDEGIFEDDQAIDDLTSDDLTLSDCNNRHNSQPP